MKAVIFLLFFIFQLSVITHAQQTVYVEIEGESIGKGIIKSRGGECFVIIPHHVLKDREGIELFDNPMVYAEGSVSGEAEKLISYNNDLAILKFSGDNDIVCTDWKLNRDFKKIVKAATNCKLEIREKTGVITNIVVNVSGIGSQYLFVKPQNTSEAITQGMSGASLFANHNGRKVYLGMLQNIDGDTGEVLMADQIDFTVSEFFNPRKNIDDSDDELSLGIINEAGGLKFEIANVRRSGNNVNILGKVTSLRQDQKIYLRSNTIELFDEDGAKSNPYNLVLGNQSGYSFEYNLVHGVVVPFEISFNNIASSANFISLLKLEFRMDQEYFGIEARDIELSKGSSVDGQYNDEEIDGVQNVSGVKFHFIQASKIGDDVICHFRVTSKEKDKLTYIRGSSVLLYDNEGGEYKASNFTFANKSGYTLEHLLIHGVEIPLQIEFKNVNSNIESISLLKVGIRIDKVNGEFQLRHIPLEGLDQAGGSTGLSENACSELFVYRMKGFMQCDEGVQLLNHGEKILKLDPGTRFKTVICEERELELTATIGSKEIGYSGKRLNIELGEQYYLKVGCALDVSKITVQDLEDGYEELNKKGKYSKDVKSFKLNEW